MDKIYLTGYTGYPPRKEIAKVALGSENRISWEYVKNISTLVKKLKKEGISLVICEQDTRSQSIYDYSPHGSVALLMGNEVRGVSKRLRDQADDLIHIPMLGGRKSLNVSVACGIAAFEIGRKMVKKKL